MRPLGIVMAGWGLSGLLAAIGSILGNGLGQPGLLIGAVVGGLIGVMLAVIAATRFQWIAGPARRAALLGGAIGFGVAAAIAASNLHTPVIPILSAALAGLGMLAGARLGRAP